MKKLVLLSLVFILCINCKSNKEEVVIEQKSTPLEREEIIENEIYTAYLNEVTKCSEDVVAMSNFNDKNETWSICENGNESRVIQIKSYKENVFYKEIYFEQNNDLVYAEESINQIEINHFKSGSWKCGYYMNNGNVISLESLGHGKTEDDEWSPELIFEMYKKRLSELSQIKE